MLHNRVALDYETFQFSDKIVDVETALVDREWGKEIHMEYPSSINDVGKMHHFRENYLQPGTSSEAMSWRGDKNVDPYLNMESSKTRGSCTSCSMWMTIPWLVIQSNRWCC